MDQKTHVFDNVKLHSSSGGVKVQVTGHRSQVTIKNTCESTVSSNMVRIYLFCINLLTL